ncbi:hypothetical protein F4780DRAFT_337439 [Xylariomycetidae sp. FL0641]|nr:hypothetical protein F4780DRAFT_337439 [Xylariomycetidae sp. FL0641]
MQPPRRRKPRANGGTLLDGPRPRNARACSQACSLAHRAERPARPGDTPLCLRPKSRFRGTRLRFLVSRFARTLAMLKRSHLALATYPALFVPEKAFLSRLVRTVHPARQIPEPALSWTKTLECKCSTLLRYRIRLTMIVATTRSSPREDRTVPSRSASSAV